MCPLFGRPGPCDDNGNNDDNADDEECQKKLRGRHEPRQHPKFVNPSDNPPGLYIYDNKDDNDDNENDEDDNDNDDTDENNDDGDDDDIMTITPQTVLPNIEYIFHTLSLFIVVANPVLIIYSFLINCVDFFLMNLVTSSCENHVMMSSYHHMHKSHFKY